MAYATLHSLCRYLELWRTLKGSRGSRVGAAAAATAKAAQTPYIAFCRKRPAVTAAAAPTTTTAAAASNVVEWFLLAGNHFAYVRERETPLAAVAPGTAGHPPTDRGKVGYVSTSSHCGHFTTGTSLRSGKKNPRCLLIVLIVLYITPPSKAVNRSRSCE